MVTNLLLSVYFWRFLTRFLLDFCKTLTGFTTCTDRLIVAFTECRHLTHQSGKDFKVKISIQQLRYLIATVSAGSITGAAHALSVSQGTISEAISQIEAEAGVELFTRKRKPLVLTETGEEFLGYARGVVKKMDTLESRFGGENKKINFAVSSLPFRFSVNALGMVSAAQPNDRYEFSIDVVPFSKLVQDVSSGSRDFGVLYLTEDNEMPMLRVFSDSGLVFKKMFEAKPHILINPHHPLAGKSSVTFDDLRIYPKFLFSQYIYVGTPSECEARLPYTAERAGGLIQMDSVLSLSEFVNSFASMDGYMIWCDLVPEETNPEELASVPIEGGAPMTIGYLKPADTALTEIERQYIDAMMTYAPENRR